MRTTPIVPCPHIPRTPALLKKITPHSQDGSGLGTRSAPTSTSLPRGSFTLAERNQSWRAERSAAISATVLPARDGPPETIVRVGSPSVWLSTNLVSARTGMGAG